MDSKLAAMSIALAFAGPALAQQPAADAAAKARAAKSEGFFRPSPDIALNPLPRTVTLPAAVPAPPAAEPEAPGPAPTAAPPAVERELERSEVEHERARAELSRRPPPPIVSTLDGTAPIVSPLDGTAPIISPIGR